MIGPELQKAIVDALTASPSVAGGRVFDQVPEGQAYPYITIGDDQVLDAGNQCVEGWEVFTDVHLWSRPEQGSKREVKELMADTVQRLATDTLDVDGFAVIIAAVESSRTFRDPDGLTEHSVITMRYVLEPIAP